MGYDHSRLDVHVYVYVIWPIMDQHIQKIAVNEHRTSIVAFENNLKHVDKEWREWSVNYNLESVNDQMSFD